MFGYQLFDKVSLPGNKVGFIYGRRISGCFDIRDIFGNRIKEITYRKIKLIKARENILIDIVNNMVAEVTNHCTKHMMYDAEKSQSEKRVFA